MLRSDRERILRKHKAIRWRLLLGRVSICRQCGQSWPCEARLAAEEARRAGYAPA